MTDVFIKGEIWARDRQAQREDDVKTHTAGSGGRGRGHVKMEADSRHRSYTPRAKEFLGPPEAGRATWSRFSSQPPEGTNPADT